MIKRLEVENFRSFENFKMENITPLTLVTGKNNVGKSSLLEAFFIFYGHSSSDIFTKISSLRGGYIEPNVGIWESLFNKYDVDKIVEISLEIDDSIKSLNFRKSTEQMLTSSHAPNPVFNDMMLSVKSDYNMIMNYEDGSYKERGIFNPAIDTVNGLNGAMLLNLTTTLPNNAKRVYDTAFMVNINTFRSPINATEWLGRIEIARKKEKLIEALRTIEPEIKDLFSATQNGITQLYMSSRDGVIPVKYAGDGFMRLLSMVSVIMANPKSLILIDEIENGLHYTMHAKLWEIISAVAIENNCQIIATTHSYEHIAGCLAGIKNTSNEKMFSLHRIERNAEGMTEDKFFDYDMAVAAVDNELEVR